MGSSTGSSTRNSPIVQIGTSTGAAGSPSANPRDLPALQSEITLSLSEAKNPEETDALVVSQLQLVGCELDLKRRSGFEPDPATGQESWTFRLSKVELKRCDAAPEFAAATDDERLALAQSLAMDALKPITPAALINMIETLTLMTASRDEGDEASAEKRIGLVAANIVGYPEDVVRAATVGKRPPWKWFPDWADLYAELERLTETRRGVAGRLRAVISRRQRDAKAHQAHAERVAERFPPGAQPEHPNAGQQPSVAGWKRPSIVPPHKPRRRELDDDEKTRIRGRYESRDAAEMAIREAETKKHIPLSPVTFETDEDLADLWANRLAILDEGKALFGAMEQDVQLEKLRLIQRVLPLRMTQAMARRLAELEMLLGRAS